MKKIMSLALSCMCIPLALTSCGGGSSKKAQEKAEAQLQAEQARQDSLAALEKEKKAMDKVAQLPEEPVFDIITNLGTIKVKLYADTPKHRENFAKLALSGYYNDILFHRVIKGFMIQAGDPFSKDTSKVDRWGTGGPGYTVPAEFVPEHKHKKGALAAARRGDAANPKRESSGSQFYLVQDAAACAQLDGSYTVFGETVEGIEVIDKIAAVQTNRRDQPLVPVKIVAVRLDEALNQQPK